MTKKLNHVTEFQIKLIFYCKSQNTNDVVAVKVQNQNVEVRAQVYNLIGKIQNK